MTRIAVVGMACRYPDATSPRELWENALAGRRAFRRLPDERMRLSDYYDPDPAAPDRFYARTAAVIEGYEFDRIAYKIAGSTYRSTDMTHWLALDVAALALADAGFPMAEGLPRERTGVVVGNTLTGEFSRANVLRLRWPYVRRMVAAALKEQDWDDEQLSTFLDDFETAYKSPFPEIDEDSLAGGLSNTIAGRICNHFDLKGGGYTVDGACSSSLLSVATACKTLVDGDLDVVVAGGVDLSIDPFEIIGFAKTGALASAEMRVYDKGSNGFWPGEGCGMVVLMREEEARQAGHRIYATIAGWGISSDGKGGITRPEVDGYKLALRRAYDRAGFGVETVGLFEGHGTGTKVGDATELRALTEARSDAEATAAIGSIKGMIGHTKAAAGVAGLIKAAMAVHSQVLPPTLGCFDPHDLFSDGTPKLRMLRKAEPWPAKTPVRAGITAMGFGGINTHIVLENTQPRKRVPFDTRTKALAASLQDAELLLVDAGSATELRERLQRLVDFVPSLAYAQLSDLAATLHRELRDLPYRAAVVVTSPEDAEQKLRRVCDALDAGETTLLHADGRALLGHATGQGRIGYLFPGQGSGRGTSGGALRRRFAEVEDVYVKADLPTAGDMVATSVAQPRIVTGSMAAVRALSQLGLEATVAVGHSLGEISALCWAGAMDEQTVLRAAATRGQTMAEHSASGTMASIGASPGGVAELIEDLPVVIAGYNGPENTVIAGPVDAIEAACERAQAAGATATMLRVSHAFHSPLVAPAAGAFAAKLHSELSEEFGQVQRRIMSTVTGDVLAPDTDIVALLHRQITDPVLFTQAIERAAKEVDLFVEVGPGRVLSGLASVATDVPSVALDTDDESITGLLRVVGAAYVVGASSVDSALFHGRLTRPLKVGAEFKFFTNPCEAAPPLDIKAATRAVKQAEVVEKTDESTVDLLRRLASERAELPLELVREDSRLLDDLHLSSITVGQLVNQLAQHLGIPPAQTPTNLATATVKELVAAMETLASTATDATEPRIVAGAGDWARPWTLDMDELPLPPAIKGGESGEWRVYADAGHPLAEPLRKALQQAGVGSGVLVCLPKECGEEDLQLALLGAKAAPGANRFVLVQHGRGAAGLAKTLKLEAPQVKVTIVHAPPAAKAVPWIVNEVAATSGFAEAHYDEAGKRRVPTLRVMPYRPTRTVMPLGEGDVLLVTGGGKGITAECAIAMAADSGARLALLGRSDPAKDTELAANLRRMAGMGLKVAYASADVTNPGQVRAAVETLVTELGPVTAVLHGAGRNEPAALSNLDMAAFERTFAPKIDGLRAVLAAVDPAQVRLLVTLGSIIGRAGLRGEAHYATANEWLADLTLQFGAAHPHCRVMCLEWSVWSGVGMGERLDVVESLAREGVTPISPDQGMAILRRLLEDPDAPSVVVISGRTEGIDTVRYDRPPLPLLRFVDKPLIRYHGVELVTEVALSGGTDLYLPDHLLDGNLLFPAVFGMEAMTQVAYAMTGRPQTPVLEDVSFLRPIVVPPDGSTTIRVAAVVTGPDSADVVIRSAETGFAADHFRARLVWPCDTAIPAGPPDQVPAGMTAVRLHPAADLYGDTLFQGGRFQRLRAYHRAAARHVDASLASVDVGWFAGFLPSELLLGDPGVRDALMHGNQVCVPDATLLPAGIERLYPAGPAAMTDGLRYCATERSRDGDTYLYDIALRNGSGEVIERWEGLKLQAVRKKDGTGPWVAALLGSYLERAAGDLIGARASVVVEPSTLDEESGYVASRRAATAIAASRAAGEPVDVRYRPDGRPELDGGRILSAAHGAGVTLCVVDRQTGPGAIACDVEPVEKRPEAAWRGLLGPHFELATLVGQTYGEQSDVAATRVWAAIECLQKAGLSPRGPLTLQPANRKGWAVFAAGEHRIAALATTLRGLNGPVVFAILARG